MKTIKNLIFAITLPVILSSCIRIKEYHFDGSKIKKVSPTFFYPSGFMWKIQETKQTGEIINYSRNEDELDMEGTLYHKGDEPIFSQFMKRLKYINNKTDSLDKTGDTSLVKTKLYTWGNWNLVDTSKEVLAAEKRHYDYFKNQINQEMERDLKILNK